MCDKKITTGLDSLSIADKKEGKEGTNTSEVHEEMVTSASSNEKTAGSYGDRYTNLDNPTEQDRRLQECIYAQIMLKNEKKSSNSKLESELHESQQQLLKTRDELEKSKTELNKARKELAEQTAVVSHIMTRENKGGIESPSDPFSHMKIAQKLKNLYDEQAALIVELFGDEEVEGIKFISRTMEESYKFCKMKAKIQILAFTSTYQVDENHEYKDVDTDEERRNLKQVLTEHEINELYLLRWKTAISEENRDNIMKEFISLSINKIDEKVRQKFQANDCATSIENFLSGCADVCWLISTCYPSLKLRFDVRNKLHEKWIRSHFKKYTTKALVTMPGSPKGFITCVVWPALTTADERLILQQGEVITVD